MCCDIIQGLLGYVSTLGAMLILVTTNRLDLRHYEGKLSSETSGGER